MKARIGFTCSILLLLFGLIFSVKLSNGFCLGDYLLRAIGLPAWTNDEQNLGLHYSWILVFLFVSAGWIGVNEFGNKRYSFAMMFIYTLIAGILINPLLEWGKDIWLVSYNDLRSVEYRAEESSCKIDMINEEESSEQAGQSRLNCNFSFINHSNKDITFHAKLLKDEDTPPELGYVGQKYMIELPAHASMSTNMEKIIPKTKAHYTDYNGEWYAPKIAIYDGKQEIIFKTRH